MSVSAQPGLGVEVMKPKRRRVAMQIERAERARSRARRAARAPPARRGRTAAPRSSVAAGVVVGTRASAQQVDRGRCRRGTRTSTRPLPIRRAARLAPRLLDAEADAGSARARRRGSRAARAARRRTAPASSRRRRRTPARRWPRRRPGSVQLTAAAQNQWTKLPSAWPRARTRLGKISAR